MIAVFYFFVPFVFVLILTPIMRRLAKLWHVFAHANVRTIHEGLVPKLGGAAIYIGFVLGIFLVQLYSPARLQEQWLPFVILIVSSMAIFVLGTFDDKLDLGCNLKLFVEILAAVSFAVWGWRVEVIILPGLETIPLGWTSYPLTVLWIVGLTNAINLIDGLDGLASGIIIIGSLINMAIAALFGNIFFVWLSLGLAGAVIGFLRYNINPASIFMGDSGSLSLGFIFAGLSVGAASLGNGQVAIVVPLLLMALPLTDTFWAIIRRVRKGIHPFRADRQHIHHRLVNLGLSQGGAAMIMVGLSFLMGVLAFLVASNIHAEVTFLQFFENGWVDKVNQF
ncbi:undecaprenyl/decaprenyl-phosphate alpha-N-acetylglucosaminyl 1-phosphate transferase [candidate division KSB1 bacterium]|nr:undecaprenyl/decaprenyl-phosphate alpha-N-acetylglucosaminyl 1-phosphate transferase [candidate division KSB1 bacterium]